MARSSASKDALFDDSCPFDIAEAVLEALGRMDGGPADEKAAWEAFLESRDAKDRAYFEDARRTRQPIHLYQQQRLYEFGIEAAQTAPAEFCSACGKQRCKRLWPYRQPRETSAIAIPIVTS